MSNIKITALTNIGANVSYTTLVPVVNMAGTPETQKANLQIVGNLILSGAGGANFVAAAQASVAQTVSNAAQPNITSVGTLTNLVVSGNITANSGVFTGNGAGLANLAGGNVQGYVAYAAVANSVAVANVSGLGNISVINLDGNASNVLRGNGIFSNVPLYPNAVVWTTAPVANNSTGIEGQAAYDAGGNLYICVSANAWAKFAGTTSW